MHAFVAICSADRLLGSCHPRFGNLVACAQGQDDLEASAGKCALPPTVCTATYCVPLLHVAGSGVIVTV